MVSNKIQMGSLRDMKVAFIHSHAVANQNSSTEEAQSNFETGCMFVNEIHPLNRSLCRDAIFFPVLKITPPFFFFFFFSLM